VATQVHSATNRLVTKARRNEGSPATSANQRSVKPVGSSVLVQTSPNEPSASSPIGSSS
jgi:hypothetical protein